MSKCSYCMGLGCKICGGTGLNGAPTPKYRNTKTTIDGIKFDSKNEAEFYEQLKLLKAGKQITDFELQPVFEIFPAFEREGKKYQAIKYIADFKVTHNDGSIEIVDVKSEGTITDVFKLKQKMFLAQYPLELSLMVKCPAQYGQGFIEYNQLQELKKAGTAQQRKGRKKANGKGKSKG